MTAAAQPESTEPTIPEIRKTLIRNGYFPVPARGKQSSIDGWSTMRMTLDDVDRIGREFPYHTNTGLLCGEIVAIDIDAPDPETAAHLTAMAMGLPGADRALQRVGRAPKITFLFRATTVRRKVATDKYVIDGHDCQVEILGDGQQFIAFGTHPDTGQPYRWLSASPLEVPAADLPAIDVETIDGFVCDADAFLARHGTLKTKAKAKAERPPRQPSASDTPWDRVNAAAFDNLDAWVPHLRLDRLKRYNDGYHAVASFRQSKRPGMALKDRDRSLNIQPVGICDHSDGEKGYSPISLVSVCSGYDPKDALLWLCEKLNRPPADFGWADSTGFTDGQLSAGARIAEKFKSKGGTMPEPANDNDASDAPAGKDETGFPGIMSSGEFVRGFVPPDYLVDGIIQSGFLYSITGQTGAGKTAVALLLAACIALGAPLAGREVKAGRILYFAGENPDDVRMRWIGLCHELGLDPDDIDAHFIEGVFSIPEFGTRIAEDVDRLGGVACIFVDTTAAYFPGTDENSNVEMGNYARLLRTMTRMDSRPAVIAASHPIKNPNADNLLPRGGGAFLNEVDGNLALAKKGERTSELHWQGKFRGPDFRPIVFDLPEVKVPTLVDSRGREIPTVRAKTVGESEIAARAAESTREDQEMLIAIRADGNRSLRELADALGWTDETGKRKAQTVTDRLKRSAFIIYELGQWKLTKKGEAAAPDAARTMHAAKHAKTLANGVINGAARKRTRRPHRSSRDGTDDE